MKRLGELAISRQPEEGTELETLHRRYLAAPPPGSGEKATIAYRLRLLYLDRWNLWGRLTRYRTWQGPNGETLDGTNNGSERVIGWWIKERYRAVRGYKRPQSAVNVSRLLAWCGNHLDEAALTWPCYSRENNENRRVTEGQSAYLLSLPNFEQSPPQFGHNTISANSAMAVVKSHFRHPIQKPITDPSPQPAKQCQ